MNDVRSKLTRILLLTAWLLATGSHWDVVQAFAWGRMLVTNAQVLPLRDALELTFSTDGRCDLCATVQEHRPSATDDEATVVNLLTREPLVFQTVPSVIVEPPDEGPWIERTTPCLTRARIAPPTPPPRHLG